MFSSHYNLHKNVKIQKQSREGRNITKNLLAEVTIHTVGFFTFVTVFQELCPCCRHPHLRFIPPDNLLYNLKITQT